MTLFSPQFLLPALCSYLIGAIPFGLIIAKLRNVDLRTVGSGNIGATNVFRSVSKMAGILTLFLDAIKGFAPAFLFPQFIPDVSSLPLGLVCGVSAIAGHTWPVYVQFKGGKGVATSAGVLLALAPATVGIGLVSFALLFLSTRYVSVGSMGAACVVAGSGWFLYRGEEVALAWTLTALAALILWRHRANMQRLLRGEENKVVSKKEQSPARSDQAEATNQNETGTPS